MTHDLPHASKLVWIVWKDAVGGSNRSVPEALKDIRLVTNINLGWIVHENRERIVLAHGRSSGTDEIDNFVIPKKNIVERIPVLGIEAPE